MTARKSKRGTRGEKRKRRPAEETRREILEAAQKLLVAGGPEAVRLQEVARDVGLSHPAILHHFGSRQGLMGALEDHVTNRLVEDVGGVLLTGGFEDGGTASGSDIIESVAQAMQDRGLAPLIAWLVLCQDDQRESTDEASALVGRVVELIRVRLAEDGAAPGRRVPSREEIGFGVRLAVVALFGDALIGAELGQAPQDERTGETQRFRSWLADLLTERLVRELREPLDS